MAIPVPYVAPGASRLLPRAPFAVALIAFLVCGCSINLGSLTPSSEPEPPRLISSTNIAALTETIKADPNNPQAYSIRASALAQAGKTEEALADCNKAISLDPNYGPAYASRGLIFRQSKRLDLAMADYDRALALDANHAPAYLGRAMVYRVTQAAAGSVG